MSDGSGAADAMRQIQKIVGKKFDSKKFDAIANKINAAVAEFDKSAKKFMTMRDQMEKVFLELENNNSQIMNALKQLDNMSDKLDFGLDDSKADDKKTIKQCQDILSKGIAQDLKDYDKQNKDINELDKHITHISDYDPTK